MVDLLQKSTDKDNDIVMLKEGNAELEKMYKEIRCIYELLVESNKKNV